MTQGLGEEGEGVAPGRHSIVCRHGPRSSKIWLRCRCRRTLMHGGWGTCRGTPGEPRRITRSPVVRACLQGDVPDQVPEDLGARRLLRLAADLHHHAGAAMWGPGAWQVRGGRCRSAWVHPSMRHAPPPACSQSVPKAPRNGVPVASVDVRLHRAVHAACGAVPDRAAGRAVPGFHGRLAKLVPARGRTKAGCHGRAGAGPPFFNRRARGRASSPSRASGGIPPFRPRAGPGLPPTHETLLPPDEPTE